MQISPNAAVSAALRRTSYHDVVSVALLVASLVLCGAALAQDYGAIINQQMNQMNRMIDGANEQVGAMVQQKMQDPQVQAAYRQHLAQAQYNGQRPYDFPTFTYNYIYTNGFSAQGMARARANESAIQAQERAAVQGLRNAEANRGAAQQAQQNAYSNNQQEAGRQLMGNSTFSAPNGSQTVLPHTWQNNTTYQYQDHTYHVDASGQYWVQDSNGYWAPLRR